MIPFVCNNSTRFLSPSFREIMHSFPPCSIRNPFIIRKRKRMKSFFGRLSCSAVGFLLLPWAIDSTEEEEEEESSESLLSREYSPLFYIQSGSTP